MEHRALIAELEQAVAPELEALSHFLYTHPELGMEERQAVRCLTDYLQDKGFALERCWQGMETAFAARWGQKGPCIAFLAEYDALPGYGS